VGREFLDLVLDLVEKSRDRSPPIDNQQSRVTHAWLTDDDAKHRTSSKRSLISDVVGSFCLYGERCQRQIVVLTTTRLLRLVSHRRRYKDVS